MHYLAQWKQSKKDLIYELNVRRQNIRLTLAKKPSFIAQRVVLSLRVSLDSLQPSRFLTHDESKGGFFSARASKRRRYIAGNLRSGVPFSSRSVFFSRPRRNNGRLNAGYIAGYLVAARGSSSSVSCC